MLDYHRFDTDGEEPDVSEYRDDLGYEPGPRYVRDEDGDFRLDTSKAPAKSPADPF